MKRISLILFTTVLLPTFSVQAERTIIFKPPQLRAPAARVGGRTRSINNALTRVLATEQKIHLLAANRTGLTSSVTPILYWYASSVPPYSVEITVQLNSNPPLLKKNIGMIEIPGIQTIKLADYGVTLTEGQNYTWSIALIIDPAQRATDLSASANIRHETPVLTLTDATQITTAGYWYDAVTQLVETKSPQLQELLQQEGIDIADK